MAQEETTTIDQLNEEADIAADYLEGLLAVSYTHLTLPTICSV